MKRFGASIVVLALLMMGATGTCVQQSLQWPSPPDFDIYCPTEYIECGSFTELWVKPVTACPKDPLGFYCWREAIAFLHTSEPNTLIEVDRRIVGYDEAAGPNGAILEGLEPGQVYDIVVGNCWEDPRRCSWTRHDSFLMPTP